MSTNDDSKLLAFCGLYCGDCMMHKGEIADLARDLRKKMREVKYKQVFGAMTKWWQDLKEYDECYKVLGAMVKLRCARVCREGGGPPTCKVRNCCQKKGIEGCWECDEFETCDKLEFLQPIHGDAHIRNMKKISKQGMRKFLEGDKHW